MIMREVFTMSRREIERARVLTLVDEGSMSQINAAEILEISDRQVRNLLKAFRRDGLSGIVSRRRGRQSNHRISDEKRETIMAVVRESYSDFGPKFAAEKLAEMHGTLISRETLRNWMMQEGLWDGKQSRRKLHRLRERKKYFGELIQADGSHHHWFEERGGACTLLVFIDDATSRITGMRFSDGESLEGYFSVLKEHVLRYGRPIGLYTDHFSVFESAQKPTNLTQFQRALKSLDISWKGANSPQAKGRVERCNRTLQDRLVKELRLRGISTIEAANAYLPEFIELHNKKFSKQPMETIDLHRPLERECDLNRILTRYEERTLTKDLLFQYENRHYAILEEMGTCFPQQKVEVRRIEGRVRVFVNDREIQIKAREECFEQESHKMLIWSDKHSHKPPSQHPWKGNIGTRISLPRGKEINKKEEMGLQRGYAPLPRFEGRSPSFYSPPSRFAKGTQPFG